jgi:hypothetical protein
MNNDVVTKKLTPEDRRWLGKWLSDNWESLAELARYFCRFPGGVEVSCALKMRIVEDDIVITFGDVSASRDAIHKAFGETRH